MLLSQQIKILTLQKTFISPFQLPILSIRSLQSATPITENHNFFRRHIRKKFISDSRCFCSATSLPISYPTPICSLQSGLESSESSLSPPVFIRNPPKRQLPQPRPKKWNLPQRREQKTTNKIRSHPRF